MSSVVSAIPYRIRQSARARHARIVVDGAGVEVVVPRGFALRQVEPFVEEKRPWIERTLRRLRESQTELPPARLEDGGEVPYLGERLALRLSHGSRARVTARTRGLDVTLREPGEAALRAALEHWYRRRARVEVASRLDAAVARAGAGYTALQIRSQSTRWASCSSTGTMSFNWRLLLAPAEILDYVVEHEVAHLAVHDHSKRFWSLLAERCPEWRERERWLRRHGHALQL